MKRRRRKSKFRKKEEEVIAFSTQALDWAKEHTREVTAIVVALLLVSGVVWWYVNYQKHRELRAQHLYSQILDKYPSPFETDKKKFEQSIQKLEKLTTEFKGTLVTQSAMLDLGNAYFTTGAYKKGVSVLTDLLKKLDKESPYRQLVYLNLGYCYEALKKFQDALSTFEKLTAKPENALAPLAYYNLGRINEESGDREDALKYYREYLDQSSSQVFRQIVQEKVEKLSFNRKKNH